jgi:hypothetical protein
MSLWDSIDVGLPELKYRDRLSLEGKGSTTWATHSHSPVNVIKWDAFDNVIEAAAALPQNQRDLNWDFAESLRQKSPDAIVGREEDVTACSLMVLSHFGTVIRMLLFETNTCYILSAPDIVVSYSEEDTSETVENRTATPKSGQVAKARRAFKKEWVANYLIPFETKPYWKFRFLLEEGSTERMIEEWEMPRGYSKLNIRDGRKLPKGWSDEKKKVFHLIRQVYGQMVASRRRYGVIHLYERWWFCQRTASGDLMISRPFNRADTSPSVFQAILAVTMQDDHVMQYASHHPQSPTVSVARRSQDDDDADDQGHSKKFSFKPRNLLKKWAGGKGNSGKHHGTSRAITKSDGWTTERGLAERILMSDCEVEGANDNVQLLANRKYPGILIKLQRYRERVHVAQEMKQEVLVYRKLLSSNTFVAKNAIPSFHGFSTHTGVPMLCIGREGEDFDDIGIENLSMPLKLSAVKSFQAVSDAGILHGDLALRNIVQSRENPDHAKIIDFGRAELSNDKRALREQVEELREMLGLCELQ